MTLRKVPVKGGADNRDKLREEYTGADFSISRANKGAPVFAVLVEPEVLPPAWCHERADEGEVTSEVTTHVLGVERPVVIGFPSAGDPREEIHNFPVIAGKVHPVSD